MKSAKLIAKIMLYLALVALGLYVFFGWVPVLLSAASNTQVVLGAVLGTACIVIPAVLVGTFLRSKYQSTKSTSS